jgi:hypothetical protein
MEVWHDLANVYTALSQWRDAEVCLAKSQAIDPYSASRWHSTGIYTLLIFGSTFGCVITGFKGVRIDFDMF